MLFALIFTRAQSACTIDISAERNVGLQSALRSFAIVCDYMETDLFAIVCDLRSAIVCDRLRSYGNQPLTDLKSTNFLRDAWRLKHPRDRQFTWFNFDLSLASRLDSFLISRYLCAQVISCEIRPCVYSDHDFVYIEFNLNTADCRGLGVWRFNNSLLQDDKFCSSVSDLIDHFFSF